MARRRLRRSRSLAAQSFELGMAVPEVIAHRLLKMNDPREIVRMSTEKVSAFNEAWGAMAMQAFVENQRLALSFTQSLWSPWAPWTRILGKGIGPVRRRASANARRLRRARR